MNAQNGKNLPADAAAAPNAPSSEPEAEETQETPGDEPGYDAIPETFSEGDPLSPFATESDLATDHGDVESTAGQASGIEQASAMAPEQIDPVAGDKPII